MDRKQVSHTCRTSSSPSSFPSSCSCSWMTRHHHIVLVWSHLKHPQPCDLQSCCHCRNQDLFDSSVYYLLLILGRVAKAAGLEEYSRSLYRSKTFQLLLGDPEAVPGQMRYIVPPASSGFAPGSPPSWPCPVPTSMGPWRRQDECILGKNK